MLRRIAYVSAIPSNTSFSSNKKWYKILDLAYIPRIFVTDEEGNIRTSFLKGESQIYLRGENFPPGVSLRVYLVKAQRTWENNDELNDVSGEYRQVKLDSRVMHVTPQRGL